MRSLDSSRLSTAQTSLTAQPRTHAEQQLMIIASRFVVGDGIKQTFLQLQSTLHQIRGKLQRHSFINCIRVVGPTMTI